MTIEIQKKYQVSSGWYRAEGVRGLVLEYYIVLRSALKQKPAIRPCLTRCADCGILFITHPRNAKRDDLRCPFGCRESRKRRRSAERSVSYYRTAEGKLLKRAHNQRRRKGSKNRKQEGEKTVGEVDDAVAADSVGCPPSTISTGLESPKGGESIAASTSRPRATEGSAQQHNRSAPMEELDADQQRQRDRNPAQSVPPEEELNPAMVSYVQMTTSLLEGRSVSRDEILAMLRRVVRQHRMARRARMDYIVVRLNERPP